jgi:hypothetical protein
MEKLKMKIVKPGILSSVFCLFLFCFLTLGSAETEYVNPYQEKTPSIFDVSNKYQPKPGNFREYTPQMMKELAQEVLVKMESKLGQPFNREDPIHVLALADFFRLTSDKELDVYSTPMEDSDAFYFSDFESFKQKELYPQNEEQLIIRFYWEGVVRIMAQHYQLEVVEEKNSENPKKTRGKVSDMATTAMFDKWPGITTQEAIDDGKEQYSMRRLIKHLKAKGLSKK